MLIHSDHRPDEIFLMRLVFPHLFGESPSSE